MGQAHAGVLLLLCRDQGKLVFSRLGFVWISMRRRLWCFLCGCLRLLGSGLRYGIGWLRFRGRDRWKRLGGRRFRCRCFCRRRKCLHGRTALRLCRQCLHCRCPGGLLGKRRAAPAAACQQQRKHAAPKHNSFFVHRRFPLLRCGNQGQLIFSGNVVEIADSDCIHRFKADQLKLRLCIFHFHRVSPLIRSRCLLPDCTDTALSLYSARCRNRCRELHSTHYNSKPSVYR